VVPVLQDAVVVSDNAHASAAAAPPNGGAVRANLSNPMGAGRAAPALGESSANPAVQRGEGSAAPAWVVFGLGVAATGVATYFAIHAISQKNDADRACPEDQCSAQGASDNRDAITSANFATAGFIVGGVGLGLGIILFVARAAGSHATDSADTSRATAVAGAAHGLSFGLADARFRF
jgi:hypothetical protein